MNNWRGGDVGHVNSEILLVVDYCAILALSDYYSSFSHAPSHLIVISLQSEPPLMVLSLRENFILIKRDSYHCCVDVRGLRCETLENPHFLKYQFCIYNLKLLDIRSG